jgi:pantetheine-phosphate adenylyltransferase
MSMRRAIYPGSFDPATNGHIDILERGCKLFDEIIVAVSTNPNKLAMFSVAERKTMMARLLDTIQPGPCNVLVESFTGLLAHFAAARNADAVLRGIRAVSDYEYELKMALMNRKLEPRIETVFLMADERYSFVSSTLVKEVVTLGGSVAGLVPPLVEEKIAARLAQG